MEALREWADRSRQYLGVERLDLLQLQTPPDVVFDNDRVFDALDSLVEEGRLAAYGVSVETVDQALRALRQPGVATIQIVVNVFRRKPLEHVLPAAVDAGVGILARVPLASGLLSGRYDEAGVGYSGNLYGRNPSDVGGRGFFPSVTDVEAVQGGLSATNESQPD